MATYTRTNFFVSGLIDWDLVVQWTLTGAEGPSIVLVLENADGTSTVLTGIDLETDATGQPIGGTVTTLDRYSGPGATGSLLEAISGGWALQDLHTNLSTIADYVLSGNDLLIGGNQYDKLDGHAGADTFVGGAGDDQFVGDGSDTVDYSTDPGGIHINLEPFATQGGQPGGTATDGYGDTDNFTGISQVIGSPFVDNIFGSAGSQTLSGGAGNDYIYGSHGADSLNGGTGVDELEGGAGPDTLNGGGDGSFVETGGDDDFASYEHAPGPVTADLLTGGTGGEAAGDVYIDIQGIIGSGFGDTLRGDDFVNYLLAGGGDDELTGRGGGDYLIGGDGFDEARYDVGGGGAAAVAVDLDTGPVTLPGLGTVTGGTSSDGDILVQIEAIRGSNSASGDTLIGDVNDNAFRGLRGNDTIDGGEGGFDELRYDQDAASNYSSVGGGGANPINASFVTGTVVDGFGTIDTFTNIDIIRGTAFADSMVGGNAANGVYANQGFEGFRGLAGNDTLRGGQGYDEVRYDRDANYGGNAGVTVDLLNNIATDGFGHTDTLEEIEGSRGTNQNDTFIGNNLQNRFYGLGGNDSFVLGDGFDYVEPGAGNDTIDGSPTSQIDQAYDDRDFVSYDDFGTTGVGVYIDLNVNTFVDPTGGIDTIIDIERLRGTQADDTMQGSDTANLREELFQGLAGDDIIDGRNGYDIADYSRDAQYGGNLGIVADLLAGTVIDGFGDTDRIYYIEGIRGTNAGDQFIGNGGRNIFRLFDGNDTVDGGDGIDRVEMYVDDLSLGAGAQVNLSSSVVAGIAAQTAISINGGTSTLTSIEDVMGSSSNDTIVGSDGNNQLVGWLGDDSILGLDGADILKPGAGADTIDGGDGIDRISFLYDPTQYTYLNGLYPTVHATAWAGVAIDLGLGTFTNVDGQLGQVSNVEDVTGTFADDHIVGDSGDNVMSGLSGNDTLDGGSGGSDTVSYAAVNGDGRVLAPIVGVNASIPNGVNVDLSTGTASDGEGGTDTLLNIDNVIGSIGSDTIKGTSGDNIVDGGEGTDTFIFTGALGISAPTSSNAFGPIYVGTDTNGGAGIYTVTAIAGGYLVVGPDGSDTLLGINRLQFTDGTLLVPIPGAIIDQSASSDPVEAEGGQGDDSIVGGSADDLLLGGTGGDTLIGGDGYNELNGGDGDDSVVGGDDGNLFIGGSGLGNDTYTGGAGVDEVKYTSTSAGIVVDLSTSPGTATGVEIDTDTLISIEDIIAGAGPDSILGSAAANHFFGEAGADTLNGAAGNDTLEGGSGNDSIVGGADNDHLFGDSDDDTLVGGLGDDTLDGGANTLGGFDVADLADAAGVVLTLNVDGTGTATGASIGTDTFLGIERFLVGGGNDSLVGNGENNVFDGAGGNDTLRGGAGADTLTGGLGADSLAGDAGDDVFRVTGAELASGEVIDGGADDDTLFVDGGGVVSFVGTTLSGLENVVLTHAAGTHVTVASAAQAALITSAQGTLDVVTLASGGLSAEVAKQLIDAGVERIEWSSPGFASDVEAVPDGLGGFIISYDDGDDIQPWDTIDVQYDSLGRQIAQTNDYDFPGPEGGITLNFTYDPVTGFATTIVNTDGHLTRTFSTITTTLENGVVTKVDTINDNGTPANSDDTLVEQFFTAGVITLERTNDTSSANAGKPWLYIDREYEGGVTQIFRTFWDAGVNGGGQQVVGAAGSQVIEGVVAGGGVSTTNDALVGGAGADTFRFVPGFGHDTIYDFVDGTDLLDLTGYGTGIETLAELEAAASITEVAFGAGFNTVIAFNGTSDQITIRNLTVAQLGDGDFTV